MGSMQFLTSSQVAAATGLDQRQVNRLVERGELVPDATGGSAERPTRLYSAKTVEKLRLRLVAETQAKLDRLNAAAPNGEAAA